ncbi:hypothetical protein SDC9_170543 [bioreactor metagenome]|uniref:HNH nuclease domain-containing protein n=1 Tax=bioreactor metagenome TaxID=1076179 RepID=A0A645GAK1_9ZZZZ
MCGQELPKIFCPSQIGWIGQVRHFTSLKDSVQEKEIPRILRQYQRDVAIEQFSNGHSYVVDAGHTEPWAVGANDDIQNGLALSKNAHRMFDESL